MGRTASVWAGEVGGGRSADGGDGVCVCADGEGRAVCALVAEVMGEGAAAGNPEAGCCGPPESDGRGS